MAVIAATKFNGQVVTPTVTTLGASDTFTYLPGMYMIINNVTAGALTPNFDGDGGTTWSAPGIGSIDVTGGYTAASIAAGAQRIIRLDSIKAYLQGTVTVTGGDGAEVVLVYNL